MKTTVQVTCNTGKNWITPINTDLTGAIAYFMGKTFVDKCQHTTKETTHTIIQVQEVLFYVVPKLEGDHPLWNCAVGACDAININPVNTCRTEDETLFEISKSKHAGLIKVGFSVCTTKAVQS